MAHPAAKHGILTGFGGTVRLPEVLGERNAARLFQGLEQWNEHRALEAGAVHRILCPEQAGTETLGWLKGEVASR